MCNSSRSCHSCLQRHSHCSNYHLPSLRRLTFPHNCPRVAWWLARVLPSVPVSVQGLVWLRQRPADERSRVPRHYRRLSRRDLRHAFSDSLRFAAACSWGSSARPGRLDRRHAEMPGLFRRSSRWDCGPNDMLPTARRPRPRCQAWFYRQSLVPGC